MLVAAVYGICVITFLFASRSGDFWLSPGKTLALLFATMCILNWTLEFVAAAIVNFRLGHPLPAGTPDNRGNILGIWYRSFAPALGYVVAIPVLVLAIFKSKQQTLSWRFVWIGFLVFDLLIVGFVHFDFWKYLPVQLSPRYFEIAMGIPVCLMIWAMILDLVRARPIDWWTAIIPSLIIIAWVLGTMLRLAA